MITAERTKWEFVVFKFLFSNFDAFEFTCKLIRRHCSCIKLQLSPPQPPPPSNPFDKQTPTKVVNRN